MTRIPPWRCCCVWEHTPRGLQLRVRHHACPHHGWPVPQ